MDQASRIYFRLPHRFEFRFHKDGESKTRKGTIVDLSTDGAGCITSEKLEPGEVLNLTFRLPGSFRSLGLRALVKRSPGASAEAGKPATAGLQFLPETDEEVLSVITRFIVNQTEFDRARTLSLLASYFLALMTLLRCLAAGTEHYFLGTPAGAEWFGTLFGSNIFWSIYEGAHLVFAAGLIAAGTGFFLMRAWARKCLIVLSLAGMFAQAVRIGLKVDFLFGAVPFPVFYAVEVFCFAIFIALAYGLSRQKFSGLFDDYSATMASYLKK
jgi:hypothetical protein